jgi:hypothetical protein
MTGKLKVLSLSKDIKGLKADTTLRKTTYTDVNIHFRDLHTHTITFNNKKEYILHIQALSVEAESLLIEGDLWTSEDDTSKGGTITELRFWPFRK